jgi:DNA-binding SARP family transcriptional activator
VELRVRLFGEIAVTSGNERVSFPSAKALELLCLLLLHSHRQHTRETLAEMLWPAGQPVISRRYLRQTLWRLGEALEGGSPTRSSRRPPVIAGPHWVSIGDIASWWVDVREVDRAYLGARDTPASDLSPDQVSTLEAALDLCRGDLMASWYHDWCIAERDRSHHVRLSILEKLASYCEAHGLYNRGMDYANAILRHDPSRESAHQQVMRLYVSMGDRGSALRQYRRCATALKEEFGIPPSEVTARLHERIRTGTSLDQTSSDPRRDGASDLHDRLDEVQASLSMLHELIGRHLGIPVGPARDIPRTLRRDGERQVALDGTAEQGTEVVARRSRLARDR